jgi:hypothetical protein
MAYGVAALCFLCLLATRALSEYRPERCVTQCLEQAKHAYYGSHHDDPRIQLCRNIVALTKINVAQSLAPSSHTILKLTQVDPSELQQQIMEASRPLMKQLGIKSDDFHAIVA